MRTALRIFLAALTSPIWGVVYLVVLLIVVAAACIFNLVIFVGKGETDADAWKQIAEFATLRMFRGGSRSE